MPNRDQKRAQDSFQSIGQVHDTKQEPFHKKYGGLCLKFPAMIQQNGLCQAVAFLEAKGADDNAASDSNEHKLYLRDLARIVLCRENAAGSDLAGEARTATLNSYQRLTRETLHCAVWMKRYAEAVLRVKPGEEVAGR